MKSIAKLLVHASAVFILTLLTQVGGAAYLAALGLCRLLRPKRHGAVLISLTIIFYGALTIAIVPPVAKHFGRVRFPCDATTVIGCALNRAYARPAIVALTAALNEEMARAYPGSRVTVLDANFPFFDGFPLFPHLSHDDGSKVDLAFFYQDAATGQPIPTGSPSPIGYFHFERPRDGDFLSCAKGVAPLRWELAWLQPDKPAWQLDRDRTRAMILWWKDRPEVTRIFIEPYLAARLGVAGGKVRFQGCWATRHDDHLHVEIVH